MNKFTPGPWNASSYSSVVGIVISGPGGGHGQIIAGVRGEKDFAEANARLIAAAPDLLALAKQYASECAECGGSGRIPIYDAPKFENVIGHDPCEACADIRAVIAKAEGAK